MVLKDKPLVASGRRDGLSVTSAGPASHGQATPQARATAKAKARGKAKANAALLAERLANLRRQIDRKFETVRDMVQEVEKKPMAKEIAEWMEAYAAEMANLFPVPTQQSDEAAPMSSKIHSDTLLHVARVLAASRVCVDCVWLFVVRARTAKYKAVQEVLDSILGTTTMAEHRRNGKFPQRS